MASTDASPSLELPSLELLRGLSDRHVLSALAEARELTRAGLASATGLSKPTVSQAISRLIESGVVIEAGPSQGARGRAGTNVAINDAAGTALALVAGPEGVRGDLVSLNGSVLATKVRSVSPPVSAPTLARALRQVCRALTSTAPGPVRVVTLSVADPVDTRTGELVALPESPFVTGGLNARTVLTAELPDLLDVPVIDNDVNWAALAEHAVFSEQAALAENGPGHPPENLLHLHLGQGIGAAVILQGRLLHGARGLMGELGYGLTDTGETLMARLRSLGVIWPGTSTIDAQAIAEDIQADADRGGTVIAAVASVVRSACYLLDPGLVVLGGPWGDHPRVREALSDQVNAAGGIEVEVRRSEAGREAPLLGARAAAIRLLLESWTTTPPPHTRPAATL